MSAPDPSAWYVVACIDCGKQLKAQGRPPAKPICLHCDVIRAAPAGSREKIRGVLRPLPSEDAEGPLPPEIIERFAHIEISEEK